VTLHSIAPLRQTIVESFAFGATGRDGAPAVLNSERSLDIA
jgi:hypothetical protein